MDFFSPANDIMSFEKGPHHREREREGGDCLEIRGFEHSRERTRISLAGRNELDFPAGLLTAASLRPSVPPSVGISG